MKFSLPYAHTAYQRFNQIIYDGLLPHPEMKITKKMKRTIAISKMIISSPYHTSYSISFNGKANFQSREDMDAIIIHEMIHICQFYTHRDDDDHEGHGDNFMKEANEIYQNHGIFVSRFTTCDISYDYDETRICRAVIAHRSDGNKVVRVVSCFPIERARNTSNGYNRLKFFEFPENELSVDLPVARKWDDRGFLLPELIKRIEKEGKEIQ
jgi:hypothetical protein